MSRTHSCFGRRQLLLVLVLMALALVPSSAHAISSRTLLTPTGAAAADFFGISVASAGDVNGDGFADLIVGAHESDAGAFNGGQATVYYGGPAADAVADLTLTWAVAGDRFGVSVASAGDVNGDGFDDLIVGAYLNDGSGADAGRASVYYGGPAPNPNADLFLNGAAAGDFFGYSVASAGDVNGDGFDDLIVGAYGNDASGLDAGRAYVYFGGTSPNAVADLTLTGVAGGDNFGYSVASAGDVNGDGFADMIVGAYGNDSGGAEAGRAYVYFGGPAPDAVADLTLTGAAGSDQFGVSVASAGDVNGDGFSDLIVGAYGAAAGAGRAYVYHGGPGVDVAPDLTLTGAAAGDRFGISVSSAGDVNRDGFADLIAGANQNDAGGSNAGRAYVYYGGPAADAVADLTLTGAAPDDFFGISVASAGDVNGDGFPELIAGAYGNDAGGSFAGRAYVTAVYPYHVLSPNGGEQWVAGQPVTVRWLGRDFADLAISYDGGASWSTLAVGVGGLDENEFAVTAPASATTFAKVRLSYTGQPVSMATSDMSNGVFRIVLPIPTPAVAHRLQHTPSGAAAGDFFGLSVAPAGDVNGDGFSDVIVGAPNNDEGGGGAGAAYVYYGGPAADAVADLTLTGDAIQGDAFFGWPVASAGDVNGDGFADMIVGSFLSGRVHVFFGGPIADAVADLTLTGEDFGDRFGYSVAPAGDVNGDGFEDFIVGAIEAGGEVGRAYVYYGGRVVDDTPDLTLTGTVINGQFGYSVASAGDMNGDGLADLAVSSGAGRSYVYFGGTAANAVADLTLIGTSGSVAPAGDVNGDSFGDLIAGGNAQVASGAVVGRAYLYHGGPAPDAFADLTLTGTEVDVAELDDQFGTSVASAGDVNGDGYADLIVGAYLNDAGRPDAGRAYVYFGGPAADAVADITLTGAAPFDQLGVSVASAGDVNGDGFADVIVGAYRNDANGADAGSAYLYDCNRYFLLSPNDDEVWNVGASQSVSWLGSERADVWLSVDAGRTYDLLRHDVGGSETNVAPLVVPHAPTKFARVKVTPVNMSMRGADESDSMFTIQSSVALLNFAVTPTEEGAELSWSTDPGVGPDGLAGYRLYRIAQGVPGSGSRIGPDLIAESRYIDLDGARGSTYRLVAVNGLRQELELGRVSLAPAAPLAAWPLPYRGGNLSIAFATASGLAGALSRAEVSLYDVSGRLVRRIARGAYEAGYQSAIWDGRDDRGQRVPAGVYFLRVQGAVGNKESMRIVVLH